MAPTEACAAFDTYADTVAFDSDAHALATAFPLAVALTARSPIRTCAYALSSAA
ncbi:hypothetical protein D3C83_226060 [compost metagenome]